MGLLFKVENWFMSSILFYGLRMKINLSCLKHVIILWYVYSHTCLLIIQVFWYLSHFRSRYREDNGNLVKVFFLMFQYFHWWWKRFFFLLILNFPLVNLSELSCLEITHFCKWAIIQTNDKWGLYLQISVRAQDW